MLTINLKADLDRFQRTLTDLGRTQLPFAAAAALNDAARAAAAQINADMPSIFTKATPFTRNAVVAPRSLAANKRRLAAVVTVRPIQGKYLLHEEIGGTRLPAGNTRRPDAKALVLPAPALPLNAYRNIPAGKLARLRQQAAKKGGPRTRGVIFLPSTAVANKAHIGGYFQRNGAQLQRLTGFKPSTQYHPKFGYTGRVVRVARATFAASLAPRLYAAMRTMR